jgi:NDP-sugar pyrophosphorylase family protein
MQCVILAGGLGTRMWPETKTIPKTLLPIAGTPFATWQLSWLARSGIDSVVYCVGHLGQQIRDHVGDGAPWGLSVRYVDEGDHLRGTAGALRLANDEGVLDEDFLVLYGDSWLQVDPAVVLRAARGRREPALMTVFRNDGRWDGSNVVLEGTRIACYAKGLTTPPAEMRWIDYGLLAFRREVISERVKADGPADLAPLCTRLADEGLLAGFEVGRRFYEIGSVAGRDELEALFTGPTWALTAQPTPES